ncbi:MAG: EthD family reductase [Verrucomicrobia bacterium]|nr:EthD family reductase [Verrucomicrobiota bacterium]
MIRVSVLYPHQEGARFDWSYYLSTHMPMVSRKFGTAAKTTSVEQGIGGAAPGAPAPYVAIASFVFDSVPAFQAAFDPHAQEIMTDIRKYTSIEPVVQISEIKG